ncbi:MAG: beta-galactosidase [Clostridia bacterium]|nr:beta-galactosidase [Clostridia bacterium]
MFTFGTQYLRGASPDRSEWEKDMAHMQRLGFNTIRIWIVWNAFERREGEVDTDTVRDFLNLAEKYRLQVGILFHLHAAPAWAIEKYRNFYYVNENGVPFEPTIRPNTPSGGWPGFCFDYDEVREVEKRFIQAIMEETRKHPNVAFYEPMNEPHEWVGNGFYCYCPASVKKFRTWLSRKYGTMPRFNRAWGTFYDRFDEVRPPHWTGAFSNYADFRLFTMENIAEEIAFRRDVIKSMDNRPVIAHSWGGGATTCGNLGGMAFDDWKNAEVFDKWGYSAFPGSANDCVFVGLGSTSTRCAANGKEYWQSELNAGMIGSGLFPGGRMDSQTFRKLSMESLFQGARGLLYWQFRKERHGPELGGFAMTNYDGSDTNLSIEAGKLCQTLTTHADIFGNSTPEEATVGIVFSVRSYLANWGAGRNDNNHCVASMAGYFRIFWEENIQTDIIHEEKFGDLSKYRLIVLPTPFALHPRMAEALRDYLKNGGTVISDPAFGLFDEDMVLSSHVPGLGFNEIFGCEELDLRRADQITLDGRHALEGNVHFETFRDLAPDVEVLASYSDGSAAILSHPYGQGRAVISGVNLGTTYSRNAGLTEDFVREGTSRNSRFSKEIVLQVAYEAGVRPNACSKPNVRFSILRSPAGAALLLLNGNHEKAEGEISVSDTFLNAERIYGDMDYSLEPGKIRFSLPADETAILRLSL